MTEPFLYREVVTITDLPAYSAATTEVIVSWADDTETAKCGELVAGLVADLGGTKPGASIGIDSYSRKERDDFGNFSIVPRAFSDRGEFDLNLENIKIPYAKRVLTDVRDTPVVYIPSEAAEWASAMVIYGFFKAFRIVVPYPTYSEVSIEIEGLT
jgi:hypothetical protein